ncbi:hypothetical protein BC938DRAFT_480613 [Jimgerdemannia flammicorona]|uniref:HTH cro/C1-type domain-containing protein n=1 Tax=Jimgerdemannia flammicorona TaxID=994334 RepID=A0A433QIU5_9FUNG|nr:hypothetical protein BC938DRAFT_480613 [Jimgerdemannia flammicorona]
MVKTHSTGTLISSLQAVTNIKLREHAKQQKKLQDHYADVWSRAATENDLLSKVNILYDGIKEVKEHHPYISNLETLLLQGVTGPTVLQGWLNRLEKEIKRGQLRLSQSHVFGSILQEWLRFQQKNIIHQNKDDDPDQNELAGEDIVPETPSTENAQELRAFQDFLQVLTVAHAPSEYDLEMIDQVLCENKESALNVLRATVSSFMNDGAINAVSKSELGFAIDALCAAGYLLEKDDKEELRKLKSDDMSMNEYAGTLSILIKDFKEWDYVRVESEESPEAEMIQELIIKKYRNNKWRAIVPDQDILRSLFLQIVGVRWSVAIKSALKTYWDAVFDSLPDGVILQRDSVLQQRKTYLENTFFLASLPSSNTADIIATGYEDESEDHVNGDLGVRPTTLGQKVLNLLCAEFKVNRLAYPGEGLTVVSADVENNTSSISHAVVLKIMEVIGVNEDWLAFFARVITPQVYIPTTDVMGVRGRVLRTLRRGLPMRQTMSKLFNEVVLFVVDVKVRQSTEKSIDKRFALNDHVQLIRVVDDMILFHKDKDMVINGWKALQSIMPALGLRLNKEKCGSCIVNKHEEPDGLQTELPQKDIIYGMLRLQRDGQWIIDEETWKQMHERLGQRIKNARSVLSKVNVYNGYIRYLFYKVCEPSWALGKSHLDHVYEHFASLQQNLVEPGQSVVEYFRKEIAARFLKDTQGMVLDCMLFWPIMAGGLAIKNPLLELSIALLTMKRRGEPKIYEAWDPIVFSENEKELILGPLNSSKLGDYYSRLLQDLVSQEPESNSQYDMLLNDFNERGLRLYGRKSANEWDYGSSFNLGTYWKWIICNYSEELLENFGHVEFMTAQVVPVSLILAIRREDTLE